MEAPHPIGRCRRWKGRGWQPHRSCYYILDSGPLISFNFSIPNCKSLFINVMVTWSLLPEAEDRVRCFGEKPTALIGHPTEPSASNEQAVNASIWQGNAAEVINGRSVP